MNKTLALASSQLKRNFGAQTMATKRQRRIPPPPKSITLQEAIETGNLFEVKYLLEKGVYSFFTNFIKRPNEKSSLLHIAINSGNLSIIEALLGAAIKTKQLTALLESTDENGATPLHLAAQQENPSVTQAIINYAKDNNTLKAILTTTTCWKTTPLHVAVLWGRAKTVTALLDSGASIDAARSQGNTPLHFAAGWGHIDIIRILLHRGANQRAKNNNGRTPRDWAVDSATKQAFINTRANRT